MCSNRDLRNVPDAAPHAPHRLLSRSMTEIVSGRAKFSLVLCLTGGLALSGCAGGGGWGRLVGKKKDDPPTKVTLAWSKLKEEEGRLTEARTGYERVLADQPNNVEALLGLSRMNVKAQRLVDAEQGYTQAMKLQPKSPAVLSEVGQFYAQQQRWDKAVPLLQEAQRIEPHEKSHQYTLAVVLTKAGRTSEALPHFTEAVGEAAAHYNVGRMLIETGKTREAEEHFTLALARNPQLADAEYFLNEIRAGRDFTGNTEAVAAAPKANPTQQVSGTTSASRPTVTPAAGGRLSGRPPLYPHNGYEELPPPPDTDTGASLNTLDALEMNGGILQTAGFTPAVDPGPAVTIPPRPIPQMRLMPSPNSTSGQVRISSSTQFPAGK